MARGYLRHFSHFWQSGRTRITFIQKIDMENTITEEQFSAVDLRVGTIIKAEAFPEARKPAYKLWVDLGELGIKKSSAQITQLYSLEELVGQQVICVTNFPAKQIGPWRSEVLVTGFEDEKKRIVLAQPKSKVPNGQRLM